VADQWEGDTPRKRLRKPPPPRARRQVLNSCGCYVYYCRDYPIPAPRCKVLCANCGESTTVQSWLGLSSASRPPSRFSPSS